MDFKNDTKHQPTKEFIDINLDNNLIPTITKPTRITRNSATLIDNIIVGKQFHDYEANIGISDINDHLPLILKSYQPKLYKKQPLYITSIEVVYVTSTCWLMTLMLLGDVARRRC